MPEEVKITKDEAMLAKDALSFMRSELEGAPGWNTKKFDAHRAFLERLEVALKPKAETYRELLDEAADLLLTDESTDDLKANLNSRIRALVPASGPVRKTVGKARARARKEDISKIAARASLAKQRRK